MGLRIRLYEAYEPIARMMYDPTNAYLAPSLAMGVVVIEHIYSLSSALARMIYVSRMEVTVGAVVTANWTEPILELEKLSPKRIALGHRHRTFPAYSPRSQSTSTANTAAKALSS